jgi:hypothetical protein
MALAENIDSIIATSPALKRLTPERRAKLATRLAAAESAYRTCTEAPTSLKVKGGRVTMRRDLEKAEQLVARLDAAMATPAIRHLTRGARYNLGPIYKQLKFARSFFRALDEDMRDVFGSGHGGRRHLGDLDLHDLVRQLVRAYKAATSKELSFSAAQSTGRGGPSVRFVAKCFDFLKIRKHSPVSIARLIDQVISPF